MGSARWREIDPDREQELFTHALEVRHVLRGADHPPLTLSDHTLPICDDGEWITSGCPYPMSGLADLYTYEWGGEQQHEFEQTLKAVGFNHERLERFIADLGWHWSSAWTAYLDADGKQLRVPWLEPFAPGISDALHTLGKTGTFRRLTIGRDPHLIAGGVVILFDREPPDEVRVPVPSAVRAMLIAQAGMSRYLSRHVVMPSTGTIRCAHCDATMWSETVSQLEIVRFGAPRWCPLCLSAISNRVDPWQVGGLDSERAQAMAIDSVHLFHQLTGQFPTRDAKKPSIAHAADDTRDRWVKAVMLLPGSETATSLFGGWPEMLDAAGVLDLAPRRGQSGVVSVCNDGHVALSLAERVVCDFLHAAGIAHDKEPLYPFDRELNPNTKLRADWAINGCFVEYAGRMSDSRYAANIERKRQLARQLGLEILVLFPSDLRRLADVARCHWFV